MPKSPNYRITTEKGSKTTLNRMLRDYSKQMVRCPACSERLSLEDYVHKHTLEQHGWNHFRVCIYCSGEEHWPGQKRNFKHIVPCLKRFLVGPIDEPQPKVLQRCEECQKIHPIPRDMYGRGEKEDVSDYMGLFESWYERPEAYGESDITFTEESGLGRDIYAIVQRYLKKDLKWYHLMVIQENFRNFVEAFDKMKHRMFLLPFWCLCDGLTMDRRIHRHMIMAVEPEAPFTSIWTNKVKYKLKKGGKSKKLIRIKTAFHLIRVIQYVSQRKASCDGKRMKVDVSECSHFYINRPLYEHAIVCMSMMFRGGLQCLVVEQNKNKDVVGWLKYVKKLRNVHSNLKYCVPIGRTGFKFLNCVLPLSRELEPSEEETPLWLYWIGNEKLYLKADPTLKNLSLEGWYARQVEKGNTLTSISEKWYVLYRTQKNVMKQIMIALERQKEVDERIRKELCRENNSRIAALETGNADLIHRMTALEGVEAENTVLRQKLETVKRVMLKLSWVPNESTLNSFIANLDCNLNWYSTSRSSMEEMRQYFSQLSK